MREFSFRTRQENISKMSQECFDLVIIGGGITGAGVARDAASRGMRVALVEGGDFASGTSSRSSKLIHGGIRYLENLEFHLVFEALSERAKLFELAPHLVHPLRFVIPVYSNDRVGMFKLGMGMWLYDALAMFDVPQIHEHLSPSEVLERIPYLREEGLLGGFAYSDAYMDDDQLVIETLRSAHSLGAVAANFVTAQKLIMEHDKAIELKCLDKMSGREFEVRGKHFVSTVGPWTDLLASSIFDNWRKILRPSKGIHITLDRERFPLTQAVVMAVNSERRIVFAIPRHDMVIIGTTDTDFSGNPQDVKSTPEDIAYLIRVADSYFPSAKISQQDIIASYAGVRPLVDDSSTSESQTSREHIILSDKRNITFVAGGKYTTYRKMSEDVVEKTLENFSWEERAKFWRSSTREPLNPRATAEELRRAKSYCSDWASQKSLSQDQMTALALRYAMETEEILELGLEPLEMEVKFAIYSTMCVNLVDFYLRRSQLFLGKKDHGFSLIPKISMIFASELGWSSEEVTRQQDQLRQHWSIELGWKRG